MKTGESERLLYRPREVADLLGISRTTAYELIEAGEIPSLRLGKGCLRVPADALRKRIIDVAFEGKEKFGIESTPTFFINGVKFVGAQPYEEFAKALAEAESKAKS